MEARATAHHLSIIGGECMRSVQFTDPDGRRFARLIPDNAPDSHASIGIPLGPPDLGPLQLPLAIEVRLNQQLYARGLITPADARGRESEFVAALNAALKVEALAIHRLYMID